MPPLSPLASPLPQPAAVLLLLLPLLLTLSAVPTTSHPCSNPDPCPPFTTSALSFPFSNAPGCGHPSFQIQCSPTHSTISINNLSFSLLSPPPSSNSSSLLLSPLPSNTTSPPNNNHRNCTSSRFLYIPNQPIDFSNTPFRLSDRSCSRLYAVKPCPPPNLPNCIHCPYDCKLIKNPLQIVQGCGSNHRQVSSGCQKDVLGVLDIILSMGVLIEWDANRDPYFSSCKTCRENNGYCGFNSSDPQKPFLCFLDQNNQTLIRQNGRNRTEMLCLSFAFFCLLFVVLVFCNWKRSNSVVNKEDPTALYFSRHRSSSTTLPPIFTYEVLESSTNRFDPNQKIGDGGFGTVYLGNLPNGKIVAVKHLHKVKPHPSTAAISTKAFCNEILILSSINHPNMVKIHGYCPDPRALLLVYDYVPNGTLAEHLHCVRKRRRKGYLNWKIRVDIALQIATAMEYLHFDLVPPIVHRDITSSNIFVENDMRVKLGDFGMSRIMGNMNDTAGLSGGGSGCGCVWTGPQGTPGYLDPDYYRSFMLTEKSDVYSFGVVLWELVTGMRAVDGEREKGEVVLVDFVVEKIQMRLLEQVMDKVLLRECGGGGGGGGEVMREVEAMAELAFRCVAADKDDRPDAREVVAELRRIRNGCGGKNC